MLRALNQRNWKPSDRSARGWKEALGRGDHRYLSQGELINKENLAKSIVAAAI